MLDAPLSPAQEAGQAIRRMSSLRRWMEVRRFYRAIFGGHAYAAIAQLTTLTFAVWDHPEAFR